MPSETSEKRAKNCILSGPLHNYSWDLVVHVCGEVDNIKLGKKLIPNWRHKFVPKQTIFTVKKKKHGTAVGVVS